MKALFRAQRREETAPEGGAFTAYLRSLEKGEPDSASLSALHHGLRTVLKAELRRRGLWNNPPSYLGVFGWASWGERTDSGDDALEELRAEAYPFLFVDRLRILRNHLAVKPNIDGMVLLAVRQFIQERQEKHDPIGAQVYAVLRSAVREALQMGELHLLQGSDRIGNDTFLGFRADAKAELQTVDLKPVVARWNSLLMPDLVTNRGRRQEEVVRRLRELLLELRQEGAEGFCFKDLIDPFKADVRARWASAFEQEEGETGVEEGEEGKVRRVRLVQPERGVEERQFLHKVIACVLETIAKLDVGQATQGYLYRLWQFCRMQAVSGDDRVPSARKLQELLDVPRERVPELFRRLGEVVEGCCAANSGELTVTSLMRGTVHGNS